MGLSMALANTDKLKAVVCANTTFKCIMLDLKYKEKQLVTGYHIKDKENIVEDLGNNLFSAENYEQKLSGFKDFDERILDYARSKAPFLFVSGDDDKITDPALFFEVGKKIAKRRTKENVEFELYSGLGHLLDPPYSAVATEASHVIIPKPGKILYGGHDLELHSLSQEQAWPKIVDFFGQHLF